MHIMSHAIDDEDNVVCSLLTYSTTPTGFESNNSLDSKIKTSSGILNKSINITQIMKENINLNYNLQGGDQLKHRNGEELNQGNEFQTGEISCEVIIYTTITNTA